MAVKTMNRCSNYRGVSHVDNELQQNGRVRSEPVDVVLHEMNAAIAGARHLLNEIAAVNAFLVTHNNVIDPTIPDLKPFFADDVDGLFQLNPWQQRGRRFLQ